MKKGIILFVLLLLMGACSGNDENSSNSGEFSIENISTAEFENNESYFIVMPLNWSGDNPATIKSVELINQENEPLTLDTDHIAYEFSGASKDKRSGVYAREDVGEIQEIEGFEVTDEATLVLEISISDVSEDLERRLRITYSVDGDEQEQVIESSTFQNLRTQE